MFIRESQKEALEQDNRLPEAGVQIIVGVIEQVPCAIRLNGGRVAQIFRHPGKGFVEILDKLQ